MDANYKPTLFAAIQRESQSDFLLDSPPKELTIEILDRSGQALQEKKDAMVGGGSLIAVVPITGVMTRHGGWFAVGTSKIGRSLRQLDADPSVGAIVLDIDSPGGSVYGTDELASVVYEIRQSGRTKIVAVADPLMASAATWVGTAAEKVYAIGSADVGSIGVISTYTDYSAMLEAKGIKVTIERTPEMKAIFSGVEPATDEMRETMREQLQQSYEKFISAMARNRGVDRDSVETKFGGGKMMNASLAVRAGLIDGVASIDEVVADLVRANEKKRYNQRAMVAKAELDLIGQ